MKALGEQKFLQVNAINEQYFLNKWGNPNELVQHIRELKAEHHPDGQVTYPVPLASSEAGFQPQYVLIKGLGDTLYWLEHGHRRPVEAAEGQQLPIQAFRIPVVDLIRWPIGEKITASQVQEKWQHENSPNEGQLVSSAGRLYWLEQGIRRRIVSGLAASMWGINSKSSVQMDESDLLHWPEGLPVIAPVKMVQRL